MIFSLSFSPPTPTPPRYRVPLLPRVPLNEDVRGCCMKHGMTHTTCLNRMCDAKKADFNEIADLMVCAPWANISFRCLVNNINHTPCCIARGIPIDCLAFCAGNVTDVTFNSFK